VKTIKKFIEVALPLAAINTAPRVQRRSFPREPDFEVSETAHPGWRWGAGPMQTYRQH
jgi:hypothetical protein